MALIVVTHEELSAGGEVYRAVIAEESLPEFAEVGWTQVGPWCLEPGTTLTDAEWAALTAPPRTKKAAPTTTKENI